MFAPPRSLYVHVPFCRSKCAYCDFASAPLAEAPEGLAAALVDATLHRIDELVARFGPASGGFSTVYVGGGTPTVLPRPLFARLLEGLARRVVSPCEWTVEANPESLDREALAIMRGVGVSRISLGVQSLDDALLRDLSRPASAAVTEAALALAVEAGFSVSADLIAGLPRAGGLAGEAAWLLDRGVCHLSVYDLILEEGTPLSARAARGELALLSEDEALAERMRLESLLIARGFRRYEVSNYAPPEAESLHNLAYWRMDSYLGAGPGAVSTLVQGEVPGASLRLEEMRDPESYLRACSGEIANPATETPIAPRDAVFEALMMGYRTVFGPDHAAFRARFGCTPPELLPRSLAAWSSRLVPAASWPGARASWPGARPPVPRSADERALDGRGLDLLNRFLLDCLAELEERSPSCG